MSSLVVTQRIKRKRIRLVIVDDTVSPKSEKKKPKKAWTLELAKSSRSKCKGCGNSIEIGTLRLGVLTFYPHRNCRWYHYGGKCMEDALLGASEERVWGISKLPEFDISGFQQHMSRINAIPRTPLPVIAGDLSMTQFASALTSRYQRFRSFRFGLPESEKFSLNWNWRCFIATILVCNSHESAMLKVTDTLFTVYPTPRKLLEIQGDKETQQAWKDWMEGCKLRHVGKKMYFILNATKVVMERFGGEIPKTKEELESMPGVGRHVASITLAWVYEAPEFGIDTHVSRILKRWGYVHEDAKDIEIENTVKVKIHPRQLGRFSRAFVDHGQQVCGFTPDCENCYLRASCPTGQKNLEW